MWEEGASVFHDAGQAYVKNYRYDEMIEWVVDRFRVGHTGTVFDVRHEMLRTLEAAELRRAQLMSNDASADLAVESFAVLPCRCCLPIPRSPVYSMGKFGVVLRQGPRGPFGPGEHSGQRCACSWRAPTTRPPPVASLDRCPSLEENSLSQDFRRSVASAGPACRGARHAA
jgi:hypothetical protein